MGGKEPSRVTHLREANPEAELKAGLVVNLPHPTSKDPSLVGQLPDF